MRPYVNAGAAQDGQRLGIVTHEDVYGRLAQLLRRAPPHAFAGTALSMAAATRSAITRNARPAGLSGAETADGFPTSPEMRTCGSSGTTPSRSMCMS